MTTKSWTAPAIALACFGLCAAGAAQADGQVQFQHALTLPLGFDPTGQHQGVFAVAFSPDSKLLAVAGDGKKVALHQVPMGHLKAMLEIEGEQEAVHSLAFSPDGKTLACGGTLWDVSTGRLKKSLFEYPLSASVVAFSHDGELLATGGYRSETRIWNVAKGRLEAEFRQFAGTGPIDEGLYKPTTHCVAFSPDGKTVAVSTDFWDDELPQRNHIQLWDLQSHELMASLVGRCGLYSHDGERFAYIHNDTVQVVRLGKLMLPTSLKAPEYLAGLAWSPDGKTIAARDFSKTIHTWDLASRKYIGALRTRRDISRMQFSPNGSWLACGSYDGSVTLWAITDK